MTMHINLNFRLLQAIELVNDQIQGILKSNPFCCVILAPLFLINYSYFITNLQPQVPVYPKSSWSFHVRINLLNYSALLLTFILL